MKKERKMAAASRDRKSFILPTYAMAFGGARANTRQHACPCRTSGHWNSFSCLSVMMLTQGLRGDDWKYGACASVCGVA